MSDEKYSRGRAHRSRYSASPQSPRYRHRPMPSQQSVTRFSSTSSRGSSFDSSHEARPGFQYGENIFKNIPLGTKIYVVVLYDNNNRLRYNKNHVKNAFFTHREAFNYIQQFKRADPSSPTVFMGFTWEPMNQYFLNNTFIWDRNKRCWVDKSLKIVVHPENILMALRRTYGKNYRNRTREP